MAKSVKLINYKELFEIWADFDDEQARKEVKQIVQDHGLGINDAFSFRGFCFGYEKGTQKLNRNLFKIKRRKRYGKKT